jgi:metal-dependent amidase/aminoacylase/carboxypeptidase family protein
MLISVRAYHDKVDEHIARRIEQIAKNAADELGAEVKVDSKLKCYVVYNDPYISDLVLSSAAKVTGEENIAQMPIKMSSEDFSQYLTKKPGVFFRLGTRNKEKGITIILITHFMEEAVRADRVIVMHDGEVFLDGTPHEVFSQQDKIKSVNLDVPPAVELAVKLREKGIDVPMDIIGMEEMVEYLCQYK